MLVGLFLFDIFYFFKGDIFKEKEWIKKKQIRFILSTLNTWNYMISTKNMTEIRRRSGRNPEIFYIKELIMDWDWFIILKSTVMIYNKWIREAFLCSCCSWFFCSYSDWFLWSYCSYGGGGFLWSCFSCRSGGFLCCVVSNGIGCLVDIKKYLCYVKFFYPPLMSYMTIRLKKSLLLKNSV